MNALCSVDINTDFGVKNVSVLAQNILDFDGQIDILTASSYTRNYYPSPRTLFGALNTVGVSVEALSRDPQIDLRDLCNIWLSKPISTLRSRIGRIGCIEMLSTNTYGNANAHQQHIIDSIKAYFGMLDIAALGGIKMDTVVMPLLGGGNQHISGDLIVYPLMNECVAFLKRNPAVKRILFIELNGANAFRLAQSVNGSLSLMSEKTQSQPISPKNVTSDSLAFISYSSPDRNIADNLCFKLEERGIKVWYAPRNVTGDYATAIVNAIKTSSHFIVILSENSMKSQHVLNEIDLAFKSLPGNIKFKPLRIDCTDFAPAFEYYLSRQHWMDAIVPPIEDRLNEFVEEILADI